MKPQDQRKLGAGLIGATLAVIGLVGISLLAFGPPRGGGVHGNALWGLVIFFGGPVAIWFGARIGMSIEQHFQKSD